MLPWNYARMTLAEFQYAVECARTTCTEQRTLVGVTSGEDSFYFDENFLARNLMQTFSLAAVVSFRVRRSSRDAVIAGSVRGKRRMSRTVLL